MKKCYFWAVFLLLIISGCTSQVGRNEPLAAKDIQLSVIYNYASVRESNYKITSYSDTKTTNAELKTTVFAENLDNTPAWLTENEIVLQEASSKTKTWIDKDSMKCMKIVIETTYGGKIYEQEMDCSSEGITGTSRTSNEAKFLAAESITVPLGTFAANKYEVVSGNSKIYLWAVANVPIPLKVEQWSNEKLVSLMELETYS